MQGMLERLGISRQLLGNPEMQSTLVRISTCLVGALYIALAAATDYYVVDWPFYITLLTLYLLSNVTFLISITRRPHWPARVYVGICLDVITISLAIFITREAISPFYLLYILVFISAGTRFGKYPLLVASLVAVTAYNLVLIALDQWRMHAFEAGFFLVLLILLPLYQYSLVRKVQDARAEAERANQAKGDFLAFMTHELRTPLTGVIGMAELLKTTPLTPEQRDDLDAIACSADALAALIGDILDFSKIDARQLKLERIPFDPRTPFREVCATLGPVARTGGLELICDLDPALPRMVEGDQLRVRQILFNLVGNAVKFTERGQVLVRARVRPAEAELTQAHLLCEVVDTGIGIAREALPRLFESFRQADESTTRRFGGTGLGTTIARELALLMGGRIGVESELGEGSRFWVRLPLLGERCAPTEPTGQRLTGTAILLIERNRDARALAQVAFEREGASCLTLDDACEASLARINATHIDLLVIADHPSGLDWARLLERLDAIRVPRERRILLVYPGHRPTLVPSWGRCLSKPYLVEDLIDTAEALLRDGSRDRVSAAGPLVTESALAPMVRDGAGFSVLVAEDNEIAARVITGFLGKMGVPHHRVADGEAALTEALTGRYAIAIVDLRMPKLDGIGFTRRYREQAPERAIPIIALTANAAPDVKDACLSAGMSAFLSKPVKPDELRAALRLVE
ncbi:MAG: response regulator [Sphingobacteriia bacterium]|nr:response regulator [Sphingobacteriia bacterium]NCC39668.1 response regulator [Gammaproteobacteria bacterium]